MDHFILCECKIPLYTAWQCILPNQVKKTKTTPKCCTAENF